ncbi:atlastin-like [Pollicipes pollicipes]|uniref:atlastin-like n=1 Tax=Pollicipes pollicipes TaxID=41117 RepID=UPI00188504C2|nr:atlastin-like [Pollicipes pollicipes]XP_037079992.1 atlastin-like [Pollicipes pollicipes]
MARASRADEPDSGHAVPILVPDERGALVLDEAALRSVLLQDEVRHLPVVVVAIAGAFRRGKSFLLSLLLRFLEAGGAPGWLGADDRPLSGFAWRGGHQRHTVGIHMWSRPTCVSLPSGERVAVVLMDTQGAFDDRTEVSENAAVFALSALTSSLHIYNVSKTVGADDLQHLQLFAEYGRVACEAGGGPPFQRLLLLVRDWQAPSEAAYGQAGGQLVLCEALGEAPGAPDELRKMRCHVRRSFSDVDCFLMPYPGKLVATSPSFKGCPRDIDREFLSSVDELAGLILSPEKLVKKQSGGQVLTAADLVTHFQVLHEVFKSGRLPQPRSLIETMSEANHLAGVSRGTTLYAEEMRQLCPENSPPVEQADLDQYHRRTVEKVLACFYSQKKMLSTGAGAYKEKLMSGIDGWKKQFFQANKIKKELAEGPRRTVLQQCAG